MFLITLDRNQKTPLYIQIYHQIKSHILDGQLKHQEKLTSEKQFAEFYDVSNFIVKRAYKLLEDEGYVRKIKGKGVFVHYRQTIEIDLANKSCIPMPINHAYTYRMIYHANIKDTSYLNKTWENKPDNHVELYRLLVTNQKSPIAFIECFIDQSMHLKLERLFISNKSFLNFFNEDMSLDASQESIINTAIADEMLIEALEIESGSLTTIVNTYFKSKKFGDFCYMKTYYVAAYTELKVSDI